MSRFPHYEVGFVDIAPELEINVKSTIGAAMRAATPYGGMRKEFGWGPAEILWLDEISVLKFFLDFETSWSTIPEEWRNRRLSYHGLSSIYEIFYNTNVGFRHNKESLFRSASQNDSSTT